MILIGIDPDVDASGYGIWSTKNKNLIDYGTMDLYNLMDIIVNYTDEDLNPDMTTKTKVIIEAAWLNPSSNHHKPHLPPGWEAWPKQRLIAYVSAYSSKIGNKVGRNHEIGRQIEKFCIKCSIPYSLTIPKASKMTKTAFKKMTGITTPVSQDAIDAINLVWGRTHG